MNVTRRHAGEAGRNTTNKLGDALLICPGFLVVEATRSEYYGRTRDSEDSLARPRLRTVWYYGVWMRQVAIMSLRVMAGSADKNTYKVSNQQRKSERFLRFYDIGSHHPLVALDRLKRLINIAKKNILKFKI